MPVVLGWGLAELAPILYGLFVTLIGAAAFVLFRAIGNLLPGIDVAFVHINPGDWFRSLGQDISDFVVSRFAGPVNHIADWLYAHVWLTAETLATIPDVLQHLGDQIAHIVTSEIPHAVDRAATFTVTHVGRLLAELRHDTATAEHAAATALSAADRAIYKQVAAAEHTIEHDIISTAAHAVDQAVGHADRGLHDLRRYVDQAVATAAAAAARDLADAKRDIGRAIAGAASTAAANLAHAESTLEQDITRARRAAAGALKGAESTLSGEISAASATAAGALTSAEQGIGGQIGQAEQAAATGIDTLSKQLGGEITSQAQAFAGDLTSLQGTLEAAIAGSVAAVAARVTKLEECAVTRCAGPNNLQSLLGDVLGVAGYAEIFMFLARAVQHPAQAEAEFGGLVGGLYHDAGSLLDELLSI